MGIDTCGIIFHKMSNIYAGIEQIEGREPGHTRVFIEHAIRERHGMPDVNFDRLTQLYQDNGVDAAKHEVWAIDGQNTTWALRASKQDVGVYLDSNFMKSVIESMVPFIEQRQKAPHLQEMYAYIGRQAGVLSGTLATGVALQQPWLISGTVVAGIASLGAASAKWGRTVTPPRMRTRQRLEMRYGQAIAFNPVITRPSLYPVTEETTQ